MKELKHKVDDLALVDRQIVEQLNSFSGVVIQFQATVLSLSTSVAGLSKEVEFLREDIRGIETIRTDVGKLQQQNAQNKGSWFAVVSMGTSFVTLGTLVIALLTFMRHG